MSARPWRSHLLVRAALSMVLSVGLVATAATPGLAQTGEVPDAGVRPAPAGQLPLPDGSFARPPTATESLTGPLAAEIAALEVEVGTLTTEQHTTESALAPAGQAAGLAEQEWRTAGELLAGAQAALDELVGDSYRGAAALPAELYIPQLPGLTAHAPVPVEAPLGVAAAARELTQAKAAEQAAAGRFQNAQLTELDLTQRRDEIEAELARLLPRLERLRDRNLELITEAEQARDAAAQEQDFPVREPVAGFRAGSDAVRAVEYALRQLGKPYLWGAEGPDRFDCSGLVWAAYRSAGRTLPRVAADQYWGTRLRLVTRTAAVARQGLLPGDLVFFSSGPAWQSVHHVGMYVGNGYMVHAPNRNEVVKVSPVWWSRFFAATRVADAVPVASPSPSPSPPPSTSPDPQPTGPGPDETSAPPTSAPPTTAPPTSAPPTSAPPTTPVPEQVEVPDVVNLDAAAAVAAITVAGLVPEVGDRVADPCPDGVEVVAAQEPIADELVPPGSTVTYQLCTAPSPSPEESPSPSPSASVPATSPEPNPTASSSPTAS